MAVQWIITPDGAIMPQVSGQLPISYQPAGVPTELGRGFTLGAGSAPQYTGVRPPVPQALQVGMGAQPLQISYSPNSAPTSPVEKIMTGVAGQHPGYARAGVVAEDLASAAPKSMFGRAIGALGTGVNVGGKVLSTLASPAGLIGTTLVGAGLGAQGENSGKMMPEGLTEEQAAAYRRAGYSGGPPVSPARKALDSVLGIAPMATVGLAEGAKSAASAVGKLFTPQEQKKAETQTQAQTQDPAEILLQLAQGQNGNTSISLGKNPLFALGDAPQMAMPQGVDTTDAKAWLEKAKPKLPDAEEQKKMENLSAIEGMLSGALSITPQDGVGSILLKVGAGLVGGYGQGKKESKQDAKDYEKANQAYAAMMAGSALDMAKLSASHQEKMAEIAFHNATAAQSRQLLMAQALQGKVLGVKGGVVTMQTTDPQTGEMSIKAIPMGGRQAVVNSVAAYLGQGASPKTAVNMANTMAPPQTPIDIYRNIGAETLMAGQGESLFGTKDWKALQTNAATEAGMTPGSDTQKNAAYKQILLDKTVEKVLSNPKLIGGLAPYSPTAQGYAAIAQRLQGVDVKNLPQLLQNMTTPGIQLDLPREDATVPMDESVQ